MLRSESSARSNLRIAGDSGENSKVHDLRKEIYHLMLTAEMNYIYWDGWGRFYYSLEKFIRLSVALISSSAVASFALWQAHPLVWKMLAGIGAIIIVIEPIINLPRKMERLGELRKEWSELHLFWEDLWRERAWESPAVAMRRISELRRLQLKIEEKEIYLPNYRWLLARAQKKVRSSRGMQD